MIRRICGCFVLFSLITESIALGDEWTENFDGYADGTLVHNVGGWRGWNGNPLDGGIVSILHARSGANSLMVLDDTDVVRTFTLYTQGKWILTTYLYIPSTVTGFTNYNLQATYEENVGHEAAVQVFLDCNANEVRPDHFPVQNLPAILRDAWVPLELFIDLDNDSHELRYNGQVASAGPWSKNFGNSVSFQAIDLDGRSSDGGGAVFYDDFSLRAAIVNPLSGDFNDDGVVDAADYTVWRDGLGSTYTQDDYEVWKLNFGQTNGSGSAGPGSIRRNVAASSSSSVPEPTAMLLIAVSGLSIGLRGCPRQTPRHLSNR